MLVFWVIWVVLMGRGLDEPKLAINDILVCCNKLFCFFAKKNALATTYCPLKKVSSALHGFTHLFGMVRGGSHAHK